MSTTPPAGSVTVSGPDLDLVVREGVGAATSRAITAAEAYGRLGATASYYVRDEAGDVRVRVDVVERGTTVWTMPTEEPRTARALTVPAVAVPSSPRRPEPVRPQPEEEEHVMAARKTGTTTKGGSARKKTTTAAKRSATTAKATKTKMSAKDAARAVLASAGGPLTTAQIVEGVLATEGVTLGGKTPAATIAAILSVENAKPDGLFERVEKGTYALRAPAAAEQAAA